MKKLGIIVSIAMLFVFAGINKVFSQTDYYVNNIYWDDSNCSCSEPIQADVRIVVIDILTQTVEDDSQWIIDVSQGYDYEGNADIKTDCDDDCYTVVVYVRLKDSGGECCSGNDSKNATGQELVGGNWSFGTVVLN
ncbi:MAG: hypothetical protein U5Q03_12745 [Bacteroidota bacterium]|nr:hypothetical protein [Bacteroidota bacterium]